MNYYDAEHLLSNTFADDRLADVYDDDRELREALAILIPDFEYPDWSHKTLGEIYRQVMQPRRMTVPAHCMDDDFMVEIKMRDIEIVGIKDAPWSVTFQGTAAALQQAYADLWGDPDPFPGFDKEPAK